MHEIYVSNIGLVCKTTDESEAAKVWNEYVIQSRSYHGRAAGEIVTWFENDEIKCETDGSLYK